MPVWRDGIESHPVYSALTAADATLDGLPIGSTDEEVASIARRPAIWACSAAVRAAVAAWSASHHVTT
jgi:hypothetical protein